MEQSRSNPKRAAQRHAETFSSPDRDAEDDALRAEFANLDLTEAEHADLAEAWRLRHLKATKTELRQSRIMFQAVRRSLQDAILATIEFETGRDRLIRALAVFDRDELARRQRIEIALVRPCSDEDVTRMHAQLAELHETHAARRNLVIASVQTGDEIKAMPKGDAFRAISRDGLEWLSDQGKINTHQALAGYAYRRRWENAHSGLRSVLASPGNTTSRKPNDMATRSAIWAVQLARCDEAIMLRLRDRPHALMLVRRVAGDGFSLSSVTGNGRAYDRGVVTLGLALDVVSRSLPYEAF